MGREEEEEKKKSVKTMVPSGFSLWLLGCSPRDDFSPALVSLGSRGSGPKRDDVTSKAIIDFSGTPDILLRYSPNPAEALE